MADSIKFTIGGQLGPSYRGALSQAVTEAQAANAAMNRGAMAMRASLLAENKLLQAQLTKQQYAGQDAEILARIKANQDQITNLEIQGTFRRLQVRKTEEAAKLAMARQEMVAQAALVAQGYGAGLASDGHGGYGKRGFAGIFSELVVILREISMGRGTGRILGSVSLLAQRLGLLGTLVKSTAQTQIQAAEAAVRYSIALNAEAVAAEAAGAANAERLLAEGAAAEKTAQQAVQAANIASQAAKVSLGPIGWVTLAVVALGAVLAGVAIHFYEVSKRAKNLADLLDPMKKKFTEQADALREDAKVHQEYLDWLQKVGAETESLPEKLDKVIKKMREQASAEQELARIKGATAKQLEQMDEEQIKKEITLTTLANLKAKRELEAAQVAADQANKAFTSNPTDAAGVDLKGANSAATNAGAILDAVQKQMESTNILEQKDNLGGVIGGVPEYKSRKANENDPFTVSVEGNEITTTVGAAKKAYEKATQTADALAKKQKELADALTNAKLTVEEREKDVKKLTSDIADLQDQLGLKSTLGRQIASAQGGVKGTISSNDWERNGGSFGGPGAALLDVAREQLKVQRQIAHNTTPGHGRGPGGGTDFGDGPGRM